MRQETRSSNLNHEQEVNNVNKSRNTKLEQRKGTSILRYIKERTQKDAEFLNDLRRTITDTINRLYYGIGE